MNDLRASNSFPADEPGGMQDNKRNVWQVLVEPASALKGQEARRQARLLSSLLIVLILVVSLGAVMTALSSATTEELRAPALMGLLAVFLLVAYILSRTERYVWGAALVLAVFSLLPFAIVITWEGGAVGDLGLVLMWTVMPLLLSSIFLPIWGTAVLAAANVLVLFFLPFFVPELATVDVGSILGFVLCAAGVLLLSIRNRNVLEDLRRAELQESNRELQAIRASLEQRVLERTNDLSRRARYLEASALVGRQTASVLDLQELLSRVVDLISEQFEFYHTGLFLLDELGEWAVLQAASSEGGQQMMARGHRLRVGQEGIVGYVTDRGVSRTLLDVGEDAIYFDNPDLPDTRSEVALPLRMRGKILGALDVQSREPAAFSQEDVAVLQTLADQVAVAISNAQLFQQVQESYDAERRSYGLVSRDAWAEMLRTRPQLGYSYRERAVIPVDEAVEELERPDEELPGLKLPIEHRGQRLGTFVAHKTADGGDWAPEEIEMVETLVTQVSVALEGARLYQDTQRRAVREQLVGEVTARMRETLDMDTVLRTAAQEIEQRLGLYDIVIHLTTEDEPTD
jgi:GAF domain-containing protein